MKRARKGKLSTIGKTRGKEKEGEKAESARVGKTGVPTYKVNAEEEKELRIKYFGETAEQAEEEIAEAAAVQSDKENNIEELKNSETDSEQATEEITEEVQAEVTDKTDEEIAEEKSEPEEKKEAPDAVAENTQENITPEIPQKKKKKLFEKKYALIFSVSLAVIIFASVFALSMGGLFSENATDEYAEEYIEPVDEVTGKINVLLLGVDNEGLRTDTIIVASFDTDDGTVNMLSIPRDTRMYVGSRYQKINAAHAISKKNGKIAGPQGSIEAVTRLTGIPINYYVEFSFKAFRETIDALGGVYFDVPQNMDYEDPVQDLYIHLNKGYQHLDGDKAEQLVRFRRYPEGDIKRVSVQQDFIKQVADQKLNAGIIGKLPELYKTLSQNIKTNFSFADMTKYAAPLMNLSLENITTHALPGRYSGSEYEASYWLADMRETKILVETVFKYDTTYATTDKPIKGAVYGKTADPKRTEELMASEPTESIKTSNKPQTATPTEAEKETSAPKKSHSPTPAAKATKEPEQSNEPQNTKTPAKPSDNEESTSENSNTGNSQASPDTEENNTHSGTDEVTDKTEATPTPAAPSDTSADNGEDKKFQRPSAN